ncbi:MAG: hypothetical protein R3B82_25830 [Sandaracinaceae bacterium]
MTAGTLALASALVGGCRWSTDPAVFTSSVAQPTPADIADPPEQQPLVCTDEGFTVVVGPEPGCAGLEGIPGIGRIRSDELFSPELISGDRPTTPIRIVQRGAGVADVEVVVRCRPFFNDARIAALFLHRDRCDVAEQVVANDCGFGGRFDDTLRGDQIRELRLAGEGAVVDVRACVRLDP